MRKREPCLLHRRRKRASCRYAKALHYKEMEFTQSPSSCIEALISINNQLEQPEAAVGILKYAEQHHGDDGKVIEVTPCGCGLALPRLRRFESHGMRSSGAGKRRLRRTSENSLLCQIRASR